MAQSYYPSGYYPNGYQPTGYYPSAGGSTPVIADPSTTLRFVFDDMVLRLQATNSFAVIEWGGPSEELIAAADDYPCIAIEETGWEEVDSYDASTFLCKSTFTATIACKDIDPRSAQGECRRLAAVASNAITGKILAGRTWGTQTYLDRGKIDRQRHPESRIILTGSFVYELKNATARSEK